jgi:hypothetical protein
MRSAKATERKHVLDGSPLQQQRETANKPFKVIQDILAALDLGVSGGLS